MTEPDPNESPQATETARAAGEAPTRREGGPEETNSEAVSRTLRELAKRRGPVVRVSEMDGRAFVDAVKDEIRLRPTLHSTGYGAEDALSVLRQRAQRTMAPVRFREVGTVQHIGDGVATLTGLQTASTDELVSFPTGTQGLILNLDHNRVDVILLGPEEGIQGGDLVMGAERRLQVAVGPPLVGRVVDPLGNAQDGRGPVVTASSAHLERRAPGIVDRAPIDVPLHTGLKIVDALVPIGRGQRELILGDRQTGKTTLAVDAILSQASSNVVCVYVAIGQKKSSAASVIETLSRHDAMAYTIVVVASPDGPPALRYLAPYAGAAIAESFAYDGRDVLIVYDDLTKHADAYRELSLLLRRPPGREAYPGDMFYAHARLLERASRLNDDKGGGSLTALAIAEMQRGNVAAYIPTNLISICDGQIILDTGLFNRGLRPAVDVGRSVSRVGGAAQTAAMRTVAGELRLELSQYEEVARFARFGTEVDDVTLRQIRRGERVREALTQGQHEPRSLAAEIVLLMAVAEGHLDDLPVDQVARVDEALVRRFRSRYPDLYEEIEQTGTIPEGTEAAVAESIAALGWAAGQNVADGASSGPDQAGVPLPSREA